jgi:hypothetical protein
MQSPTEQSARAMFANFTAGQFEAAAVDFNDALRPQITPAYLAQVKGELDRSVGQFQSITQVHKLTIDGLRSIELVAKFEKSPVSVRVVFDIRDRISAVYINPILPPPVEPALEAMARELLANLMGGHYEKAGKNFDDTMRAQLTPASLEDLNHKILGAFGTFQSVREVRQSLQHPYRIIELFAAFEKRPMVLRLAFDAQDRIASVQVAPETKQ